MKTLTLSKGILALGCMWSCVTLASGYIYSDLQMKTYDDMSERIINYVLEANKISKADVDGAKAHLKDALQLIFSRPNSDNMVSKLTPLVRTPLKNIDAYEATVDEIVTTTLDDIKNAKSSVRVLATDFIILENVLSEFKPDVKSNAAVKKFFVKIREAKIEVSQKVKSELRMRAMLKAPTSPSEIATRILEIN